MWWNGWLLVASLVTPMDAAGQSTPAVQSSNREIEAVRARLRALDEERARLAQDLAELERRAATAAGAAPAVGTTPTADIVSSGDDVRYLETIVVSGTRREAELADVPAAVTLIGQQDIQHMQRGSNLEESLRRVPGALLRDQLGGSSRVTISIRGAGATSADGARGVRLFIDGIPKNNAGGFRAGLPQHRPLDAAASIEVLRGPSSALYGNQAGGVVSITTESGGPRPAFSVSQVLGSHGFSRTHVGGGGQSANHGFNYFGTAFKTALGGFRENSTQDDAGFTGKFGMTIDDRSTLSLVTAYDHSTQRVPGELTSDEMAANPRQANPVAMAFGGHLAGARRIPLWRHVPPRLHSGPGRSHRVLHAERRRLPEHRNASLESAFRESRCVGAPRRAFVVRHACPRDHGHRLSEHPDHHGELRPRQHLARWPVVVRSRGVRHDPGPLCPGRCCARRTRLRHGRLAVRPHHVLHRESDPSAGRPL